MSKYGILFIHLSPPCRRSQNNAFKQGILKFKNFFYISTHSLYKKLITIIRLSLYIFLPLLRKFGTFLLLYFLMMTANARSKLKKIWLRFRSSYIKDTIFMISNPHVITSPSTLLLNVYLYFTNNFMIIMMLIWVSSLKVSTRTCIFSEYNLHCRLFHEKIKNTFKFFIMSFQEISPLSWLCIIMLSQLLNVFSCDLKDPFSTHLPQLASNLFQQMTRISCCAWTSSANVSLTMNNSITVSLPVHS